MVSETQIIDTKPLGDLLDKIVGGGTPSRKKLEFYNGNIPWATVKDLKGQFLRETMEYITEDAIQKSSANLIEKGTVILATRMALGKAFINLVDMAINQDLKALYPKPFMDSEFLLYAILNKAKEIERQGSGTTVKGIRLENLKAIPIDVPPFKEQQKIAAILSSVDEAIEKTEQIIEQTEKVKKGLMQQLLTKGIGHTKFKKTAIGERPKEWEISPLKEIINRLLAGVSVNSENRIKNDKELGILKTSSVTDRFFNPAEHKTILSEEINRVSEFPKYDHLIISRMNTPLLVGASSYVDKDYTDLYLPDRLWQATIKEGFSALWLSYVLTSSKMRSRISRIATGTSSSMKNISKPAFLNLIISVPNLREQKKISNILYSFDTKIKKEEQSLKKYMELKKSLMQVLLTGKVRVPIDNAEVVES